MARKKTVEPAVEVTEVTAEAMETKAEDIKAEASESEAAEETAQEPEKAPAKKRGPKPGSTRKETTKAAKSTKAVKEAEPVETAEAKPVKEKAAKAPRKESAKKAPAAEQKNALHIQYGGKSIAQEDLFKSARDIWQYDLKNDISALNSIELYVKPEDNAVYYVMNGDVTGSFPI